MNEGQNSPSCERASDVIAFLYGEAGEHEAREFHLHLQKCNACREEVASLEEVRESIAAWRDEALAGFVSMPVTAPPRTKSALAAWRQFFDLSPLWLKGATAVAAMAFCVLVGLVMFRSSDTPATPTGVVYTEQEVDRIVKEALAKQESVKPVAETPSQPDVVVQSAKPKQKRSRASASAQVARRPLTKAEREELAAELRLLSTGEDATLNLIGDRINQ